MRSVPNTLFFKPMKEEPEEHHWSTMDSYKMNLKIMQTSKGPYLRVSHTIKENPMEDGVQWIRLPYLVGEKCLDKSTGKVVAVLSCEPIKVSEVTEEDAIRYGVYQFHSQSKGLEDKPYYRSLYSAQELFRMLWTLKHPGKEWAWRVEIEEEN